MSGMSYCCSEAVCTWSVLVSIFPGLVDRDRELERDREIFRIRDRRRLEAFREDLKSLERDKSDSLSSDGAKKIGQPFQNPVVLGEELEFWVEKVWGDNLNYEDELCNY